MSESKFLSGIWRLADPKVSLASFAGMAMAALFAAADNSLAPGWLAITVLGIFFIEVGKNASGEVVDFDSGTDQAVTEADRSPFSGGKRVMVDGLLSREQCWSIAGACFALGIACGLLIVALREPRVLSFGLMGVALAWYYHGGSLRLSYRGLGELAVALAYGPLVVCGTYLVQTGGLSAPMLLASVSLGLLVAAFLVINEFPDYRADKASGKANLVVRLGRDRAVTLYISMVATAYLLLVVTGLSLPRAPGMMWGLLGLVPAVFAIFRLASSSGDTSQIIPAQAATLASFLCMAVATGAGYYFA
ncbi:prenyltransferase [Seongchinamella sediminis]|nr:prenyltransferase [Seongchinamella sediminis]